MDSKYKYYFKKPRSEIVKDILDACLTSGLVMIAATSPYFLINLLKTYPKWKKYPHKKVYNTFYRLKKQGLIKVESKNKQIYISLTRDGRKKAGIYQINNLKIGKPKKWDKKWRALIFDVAQLKRTYREALRGKLKELGFYQLQKSVWVHPFNCKAEIELLKDFFGFSEKEMRLMIVENIGNDKELKKLFILT
ncbi:MAG: hypothetical protein AUJ31_02640 [Parcubacteria group bacterium CG1_02_39_15]|nr:MAG: hypothetical protein AUJ31_02640 [Parcubacteria group bacterium CG1_02_39_15]